MSNTIYIIKEAEQVRNGEDIYKIGMTRKTIQKRISQYRKGSKIIFCFECNNIECSLFESHLINEFKEFFKQRTDFGREYFEGDSLLMIEKILMDYKMLKNKKTKEKQLKNNQQSPNEPLKVPFNEEKNNPDNNFIDNQKEEALFNNNPIYKFIEEDNVFKIKQGSYTKWSDFESIFRTVYQNYKLKTTDQTFSRMGLKITRINICKKCKNRFIKGCCEGYSKDNIGKIRIILNLETK